VKPRILVVSLNKGLLGTQAASLLGSLVVAQLWQLILGRAAVPPEKRTPVSIYIDEAQHFLHIGDIGEALEQSRSLGAAWHLAHQNRSQMPEKLLRTIDNNARNKIIFDLEDDDARSAARITGLDAEDFAQLPPYEIYTSLQSGGTRTGWFSARVLPPTQSRLLRRGSYRRSRSPLRPPTPRSARRRAHRRDSPHLRPPRPHLVEQRRGRGRAHRTPETRPAMTRREGKRTCRVARPVTLPRTSRVPRTSAPVGALLLRTIPPLVGSPVQRRATV